MKNILVLLFFVISLFGVVDINNATKSELLTLKGIGDSKANAIIEHRNKKCFKEIGELEIVKGIGKKLIEANKANIKVGECKKAQK